MISALVVSHQAPGAAPVEADLEAVGIEVRGLADRGTLVQEALRLAPDLVLCFDPHPNDALFAGTSALNAIKPLPVIIFTTDPDIARIERATRSGVHAYVINGYAANRLRSVVQVAQSRFRHEQALRGELAALRQRFEERKLVDRAKGLLMQARDLSEDEAFRWLRSTAMQGQQRVGELSQQLIDSARRAQDLNRSGQLRMLSQRLVKTYALRCADLLPEASERWFAESLQRAQANLAALRRSVSPGGFGDLLDAVTSTWDRLAPALAEPADLSRLAELDRLADDLLLHAERLTANLENAGLVASLRVINVSGRQRMLSQRVAKQALLAALLGPAGQEAPAPWSAADVAGFEEGMRFLTDIPLTTPDIRAELEGAGSTWLALQGALTRHRSVSGQVDLAERSERLLGHLDRLTDYYERSMQTLMGA